MAKSLPPNIKKIQDDYEGQNTLTKPDLAAIVADQTGVSKAAALRSVEAVLGAMSDAFVAGKGMQFRGFGCFYVKQSKATIGRNPNQPEEVVDIPEHWVVKFKPSKIVKAMLQKSLG